MSPFRRWFAIAFSVFILTFACGLFRIAWTPKVYVATARIDVTALEPPDVTGMGNYFPRPLDESTFPAQSEFIQSKNFLRPIIDDLKLESKWAKRYPAVDPLARLRSHLKLVMEPGTSVINIMVSSDVPTDAADIANAIADLYKTMLDADQDQRIKRGLASLRDQTAQQEKAVVDKQALCDEIWKTDTAPHSGPMVSTSPREIALQKLKEDFLTAQEDYDAREVLWKRLVDLRDKEFVDELHGFGQQLKMYDDGADLPFQVTLLKREMQVDCAQAQARVTLLQKRVNDASTDLDRNPSFQMARRELAEQQSILDALNVRLRQVQANAAVSQSPVRILTRADSPSHPIQPNAPLDLLFSVIAGVMLGVFAASFIELLLWLRR